MISDKERREVAARLRDEAEAWHNGDSVYEMSDYDFTESVLTAFGFDDMEMDAYKIFEEMADLIDPCHGSSDSAGSKFTIEPVARGYELRMADEDGDTRRLGVYATVEEAFARAGRESAR